MILIAIMVVFIIIFKREAREFDDDESDIESHDSDKNFRVFASSVEMIQGITPDIIKN